MNEQQGKSNKSLVEPLTERELEVLQLITEGLTNRDIADKLVVAMSTVKWHIKQIYGKLQVVNRDAAMARATALGLVESELEPSVLPAHNLPFQVLPLIGREREQGELAAVLDDPHTRLVTILGPGGMGKTRLALEVAQAQLRHFTDGVFLVSLAPLSSPEFIVSTISDAIGFVSYQGADPQQQLLEYVREKQMLLVLDNFEHLLAGVGVIRDIQAHAPAVKALVTSRERLNLYDETVYVLGGLAYPDAEETLANARNFGAIRLFEQSAGRVNANFELQAGDLSSMIRICEQLQGMPLGIELAAAWVRMFSLAEIETEIARSLDFLQTSRRDVVERHRTLRAVFDHSWGLLQGDEQAVFSALSVFRGGFHREAAEQVAQASLPILAALVDKSLLHRHQRYEIHELLKEYAGEKLGEVPEHEAAVYARHSAYYARFIRRRAEELKGENQCLALNEINAEIANIRLGWQYALTTQQFEVIERYLEGLFLFYDMRFQNQDALGIFDMAVTSLADEGDGLTAVDAQQKRLYALALTAKCAFNVWVPSFQGGRALLDEVFVILNQVGTRQDKGLPLFTLALIDYASGDYANAEPRFQESLAIYNEIGDHWGKQNSLNMLGRVAHRLGEYEKAQELLETSLRMCRARGDRFVAALTLCSLGRVFCSVEKYQQAKHLLQEGLAIYEELSTPWGIAYALNELGDITFRQGDYTAARKIVHESLAIFTVLGMRSYLARGFRTLGQIAHALNEYPVARQHFHDALRFATATGVMPQALDILVSVVALFADEGHPAQALELVTVAVQQAAITYETKESAERLIASLQTELTPEVFADRCERAKTLPLEAVLAQLSTELEA